MKLDGKAIEKIFQEAVREAIRDHAQKGNPIVCMRDGMIIEALLDTMTLKPIWERVVH